MIPRREWQDQAGARFRAEPQIHKRKLKARRFGSVHKVTMKQHGSADSNCDSRDRGDYGCFSGCQRSKEFECNRRLARFGSGKIGNIVARRKIIVGTREQNYADSWILIRPVNRLCHGDIHCASERILLARPIDSDRQNAVLSAGDDVLFHSAPKNVRSAWRTAGPGSLMSIACVFTGGTPPLARESMP